MITGRYRPWNNASTTVDTYFLVKNSNNIEAKCKVCQTFFYQPSGCPQADSGPLTRRQLHSTHVNQNTISSLTRRSLGASQWDWVPNPDQCISGIRARNFPILSVTCYPTMSFSLKVCCEKQLTIVLLVSFVCMCVFHLPSIVKI